MSAPPRPPTPRPPVPPSPWTLIAGPLARLAEHSVPRNEAFQDIVEVARAHPEVVPVLPPPVAARVESVLMMSSDGSVGVWLSAQHRRQLWAWFKWLVTAATGATLVEVLHRIGG